MTLTNIPSVVYYLITGSTNYFKGLPVETIYKGLYLNLIFLLFWTAGYIFAAKNSITLYKTCQFKKPTISVWIFLVVALFAYIYQYSHNYSYGYSVQLYKYHLEKVGTFGVIGGFANMLPAIAAALLIGKYQRHDSHKHIISESITINILAYIILIADIIVGLTIDMQRGDIVRSIILIGLIMILTNKFRRVMLIFFVSFIALMFMSPFFDYLRRPAKGDKQLSNLKKTIEIANKLYGKVFSLEHLLREPARKSGLVVSAGSISEYTDREGRVGFTPYFGILFEPIPRIIWPEKPIPMSINGKKQGQAMSIAAKEIGQNNVIWMSGGGTMYWQFGWIGVVLGGLITGFLWAFLLSLSFRRGNFYLLVIILANIYWGRHLIDGLGNFLLHFVQAFKVVGIFWLLDTFISKLKPVNLKY
ncbi:MAG: hypothetical protein GF313_05245 [Caldithrix sp.]|nr:hypothetical protein [Caldithrix sp.]